MTAQQFAERLQAKLEATAEWWRTDPKRDYRVDDAVRVALLELADCIRHALTDPKPPYKKRTNRRKRK